eukprot:scaffold9369_cov182-Amphora_coffeaeformis.AAC.7
MHVRRSKQSTQGSLQMVGRQDGLNGRRDDGILPQTKGQVFTVRATQDEPILSTGIRVFAQNVITQILGGSRWKQILQKGDTMFAGNRRCLHGGIIDRHTQVMIGRRRDTFGSAIG